MGNEDLKERVTKIVFPVFSGYEVYVCISDDIVASRQKRDGYFGEKFTGGDALGLHSYPLGSTGISWLFFPIIVRPGTVAHESWHCIFRMMSWVGADIENEVVAYHLGYLVEKVTKALEVSRERSKR